MVGMNPLEFLEEVQREYMVSTFGEVINYDEMYFDGRLLIFYSRNTILSMRTEMN